MDIAQQTLSPKNTLIVEWYLEDAALMLKSRAATTGLKNDIAKAFTATGRHPKDMPDLEEKILELFTGLMKDAMTSRLRVVALAVQENRRPPDGHKPYDQGLLSRFQRPAPIASA